MTTTRVLIVEDEVSELTLWKQLIAQHNLSAEIKISEEYATSLSEAEEKLHLMKFDAAIIDIRLNADARQREASSDGNIVRDSILKSEVMIVAHNTGEPNRVTIDESLGRLVKTFTKGNHNTETEKTVYEEIIDWIQENKEITNTISKSKKIIKERISSLFYKSIWPRWENWLEDIEDINSPFLPHSLSRHISSHLFHDLLEGTQGKVHPEEWYFLPALEGRLYTGDIISRDGILSIVVTPRCDLERLNDSDHILLAPLLDISEKWNQEKESLDTRIRSLNEQLRQAVENDDHQQAESKRKKIGEAMTKFRQKFYGHNGATGQHFLPHIKLSNEDKRGPFFVEFAKIYSVEANPVNCNQLISENIAMIAPDFLPELSQRLSAFIGRIGSPDYSHVY